MAEEFEPYSDVAEQVAEDPAVDDGTAIRRLLKIMIDVMENCMVSLWEIEESLTLRKTKKKEHHDA